MGQNLKMYLNSNRMLGPKVGGESKKCRGHFASSLFQIATDSNEQDSFALRLMTNRTSNVLRRIAQKKTNGKHFWSFFSRMFGKCRMTVKCLMNE